MYEGVRYSFLTVNASKLPPRRSVSARPTCTAA